MLTATDIRINWLLFAALGSLQAFMLVLPLIGLSPAWALLPALFTNTFWSLIHEAIHGHLFASRDTSTRAGRVLAILYGAPFFLLQRGHLLHHAFSRTPRERTEVYDPARKTWFSVASRYYAHILGGLYIAEVLAGLLLALLPSRAVRRLAVRLESPHSVLGQLLNAQADPVIHRASRLDALMIILLFTSAFLLYGKDWPWLLAAMLLRAFLISFFDNSYHYGTRLDKPQHALNMVAPRWAGLMLLNFNRHGTHHLNPGLGWRALGRQPDTSSPRLGFIRGLLRQLKGPVPASALQ